MIKCPSCSQLNPESRGRCLWCDLDLTPHRPKPPSLWLPAACAAALLLGMAGVVGMWASHGPQLRWFYKTDAIVTDPLLVDGAVVFGTADKRLCAVDVATGAVRWDQRPARINYIGKTLVANRGLIYYLDGSKVLRAVRAADGAQVLKHTSRTNLSPPVPWRGNILLADGMFLRVLDAETAAWRAEIEVDDGHVLFQPTVLGDVAFVGYAEAGKRPVYKGIFQGLTGGVYAFDLERRQVLWRVAGQFMVARPPQLANGAVIVVEHGGAQAKIRALAPQTGVQLWTSGRSDTALAFAGGLGWRGTLDLAAGTGVVEGFDLGNGTSARQFAFRFDDPRHSSRRGGEPELTDLVAAGGRLFFGCLDRLYCLDPASGVPLWTWTTAGRLSARPLVVDGAVLLATSEGFLYAVDG